MKNINNMTYVFSHSTFMDALKEWEQTQLDHYPHQQERIQTTVVAMQDFMLSPEVVKHKMIVSGNPDDFEIVMPDRESSEKTDQE